MSGIRETEIAPAPRERIDRPENQTFAVISTFEPAGGPSPFAKAEVAIRAAMSETSRHMTKAMELAGRVAHLIAAASLDSNYDEVDRLGEVLRDVLRSRSLLEGHLRALRDSQANLRALKGCVHGS